MATVTLHSDFGDQEEESVTASTFSPSTCHELMGLGVMMLVFFQYLVLSWLFRRAFNLLAALKRILVGITYCPFINLFSDCVVLCFSISLCFFSYDLMILFSDMLVLFFF